MIPNRTGTSKPHRCGYQGSGKDIETKGDGNSYTTHYRHLDTRKGRWLSREPKATAFESPYVSMRNNSLLFNDIKGDRVKVSYRTGFLGVGGRKELKYENGNLFRNDGSLYTGQLNGFLRKVKSDLDNINSVLPGAGVLRKMENSVKVFTIRKGFGNKFVPTSRRF